jgi:hypothetical protein
MVAVLAGMALGIAASNPAVVVGAAAVPAPGGMAADLRVEWEQRERGSGAVVSGYVYNKGGWTAVQVTVLAEGLDGSGQRVSSTIGNVMGTVPAFGRAYFEMRVPRAAAYRVGVLSADWIKGGGGGGGM